MHVFTAKSIFRKKNKERKFYNLHIVYKGEFIKMYVQLRLVKMVMREHKELRYSYWFVSRQINRVEKYDNALRNKYYTNIALQCNFSDALQRQV